MLIDYEEEVLIHSKIIYIDLIDDFLAQIELRYPFDLIELKEKLCLIKEKNL